jgi:S1-C subfamily serine protease
MRILRALAVAAWVFGCGTSSSEGGLALGSLEAPIEDGEVDREHSAVLAVVTSSRSNLGLCSGSLIAPNLVLTAQHCVADTPDGDQVVCGESEFGGVHPAAEIVVSPNTVVGQARRFFPVQRVEVPPGDGGLCGQDIALLILGGEFSETQLPPLAPRLDEPSRTGELYAAIGFGNGGETDQAGVRRIRESLAVVCGEQECPSVSFLDSKEFVGAEAVCSGDSGGPALDSGKRVFGVVSRGAESCGAAIYSAVTPWAGWIREIAQDAWEPTIVPPGSKRRSAAAR